MSGFYTEDELEERTQIIRKIDSTLISVSHMCTVKDNVPDANTKDFRARSSRPKTPHFALLSDLQHMHVQSRHLASQMRKSLVAKILAGN